MITLSPELQTHFKKIDQIATLPQVATEILDSLRSANTSMRTIARVIEKDPSITTKILKVANSPVWGFPGSVDNLHRALVLLGLKQVTSLVIGISLYSTFARLKPNANFDREQFWLHSFGTAQISRKLARKLDLQFNGEEFVAGLIHDLGKIVLDQFMNDMFLKILEYAQTTGKRVIEAEKTFLGCTHAEIAAWLLHQWHFPEGIVKAVQYHHYPERAPGPQDLAAMIHLAEVLCELWGIGFDGDLRKIPIQSCKAWGILRRNHPKLFHLDLERFLFELEKEMEEAKLLQQLIES